MTTKILSQLNRRLFALLLLATANGFGQTIYNQNTTNGLAVGANAIEKSATTDTVATFRTDVATAWTNDAGGVFNFPTGVTTGTTVYRGVYGKTITNPKRLQITSSVSMQNITAGTFQLASTPNGTTSTANQSDYTLTLGLFNTSSGLPLTDEAVKKVGFIILSRTAAGYPLDLRVTATYSDGSTQAVTSAIAAGAGTDDTFFGFTAGSGLGITSLRFQSFSPGTQTPVFDRIGWDDFGFITGPSTVAAPPQIVNPTPAAYAISDATNGIHFQALTYESINSSNISLVVNSTDVSAQLVFTGSPTNYSVTYNGLLADQEYTVTMNVTNSAGVATVTRTFYTATTPFILYDSQSFTNDTLYPLGNLLNVTDGRATWLPNAAEPAQITDVGDPQGKVLRRPDTGASRADFLGFPPVSSGTMTLEFDAMTSVTSARTMDICIQPTVGGTTMGSFLAWGEVSGKLAYFDNVNWLPITDLPTDWYHVKIINYLSGPSAGKFDLLINDVAVAQRLPWRNAPVGSAFNQFRIESQNTSAIFEYGQIDNLVITAGPENSNAFPPPQIANVSITNYAVIKPADGLHFNLLSGLPLAASNIVVILDGTNIANDLVLTGPGTNLLASYSLFSSGRHTVSITAGNTNGTNSVNLAFIATVGAFTFFDSGGFASEEIYPVGALQAFPTNDYNWAPAATDPGQIVDLGGAEGKVLRRSVVTNADRVDYLQFTPISSGVITLEADVRVSVIDSRVLDMCLMHPTAGSMASFLGWGTLTNYFAYFSTPSNAWVGLSQPGTNWHHYKTVNYLSGPYAGTFDVSLDGVDVGTKLPFRNNTSPVGRLRVGAIRGTTPGEYGDVDNLVMTVQTYVPSANPPLISKPTLTGSTISFSFTSQTGFTHVVEYKELLDGSSWTPLQTIPGDGSDKPVSDSIHGSNARYYRVRTY